MTDDAIERVKTRPPAPSEEAITTWFDEQHLKSADTLEEGARQIIALTSALVTALFGILSLGSDKVLAALATPLAGLLGILALVALLVALLSGLYVILPQENSARRASPSDKQRAFDDLLQRKSRGLTVAALSFGGGITLLAILTLVLLLARMRG